MANFGPRTAYEEWSKAEIDQLRLMLPRAPWPELMAAFPGRTRQAIWQKGKTFGIVREINQRAKWTNEECVLLKKLYPSATDNELKLAFPRHSFFGVQRQASTLKIIRPRHEARNHQRFVHPIIVRLYDERLQRLKRPDLSVILGYHENQILGWELGKTKPDFVIVCDWAQALGFEIILRKIETPGSQAIPYPDKRRLMAGR